MKTLILWLSVGLLLGFASSLAGGQLGRQATVEALALEPSTQPRQVPPDIPVDDLDRGTPRRTVVGFLHAVEARALGVSNLCAATAIGITDGATNPAASRTASGTARAPARSPAAPALARR